MLYAVKGNRRLRIDEKEKDKYLAMGYDIAEVQGKKLETIEAATTRTVPYAKHKEALGRIAALEKELNGLKKAQEKGGK